MQNGLTGVTAVRQTSCLALWLHVPLWLSSVLPVLRADFLEPPSFQEAQPRAQGLCEPLAQRWSTACVHLHGVGSKSCLLPPDGAAPARRSAAWQELGTGQHLCPAAEGKSQGAGGLLVAAAVLRPFYRSTGTSSGHGALRCRRAGFPRRGAEALLEALLGLGCSQWGCRARPQQQTGFPTGYLVARGCSQCLAPSWKAKLFTAAAQPGPEMPSFLPAFSSQSQGLSCAGLAAEEVAGPGGPWAGWGPSPLLSPAVVFSVPTREAAGAGLTQAQVPKRCAKLRACRSAAGGLRGGSATGGGCRKEERGRLESSEEGGRCQCHGLR